MSLSVWCSTCAENICLVHECTFIFVNVQPRITQRTLSALGGQSGHPLARWQCVFETVELFMYTNQIDQLVGASFGASSKLYGPEEESAFWPTRELCTATVSTTRYYQHKPWQGLKNELASPCSVIIINGNTNLKRQTINIGMWSIFD